MSECHCWLLQAGKFEPRGRPRSARPDSAPLRVPNEPIRAEPPRIAGVTMKWFVILGLTALVSVACTDATSPRDTADLGRGQKGDVVATSTLSLLDALGAATPATQFSVLGSGGFSILSSQYVGPEFTLTQPTTITEIGGFVNNCGDIVAGSPQCPGTLPFSIQIRPSTNGIPDAATVLASFTLSHDDDPLVISYESVAPNLTLGPGSYFALFAPQGSDAGFVLRDASDPFSYLAGPVTLGFFDPATGTSSAEATRGAVRILVAPATPQAALQLLKTDVETLVSTGELTQGQANGLLNKLRATIASLNRARTNAGCNQLGAFVNQVHALVGAGQLPIGAAQELISAVERVRAQIDCL
jgi:hypothetical protein